MKLRCCCAAAVSINRRVVNTRIFALTDRVHGVSDARLHKCYLDIDSNHLSKSRAVLLVDPPIPLPLTSSAQKCLVEKEEIETTAWTTGWMIMVLQYHSSVKENKL